MSTKRPYEGDVTSVSKKLKSESTNGSISAPPISADALIAQKRAEISAKMAAINAARSSPVVAPTPSSSSSVSASKPGTPGVVPVISDDLARRVAEAKRKVAEVQNRAAVKDNPYLSLAQSGKKKQVAVEAPQGTGLKMAAHPLLLDTAAPAPQSKKDRYKPMQPKFASIKANVRNAPTPPPAAPVIPIEAKANPYSSIGASSTAKESGFDGAPKERVGRNFRFNQKGKYVALGNQLRQEIQLEELKQRIADSAKKAGLDSEFEVAEKNVRREAPPAAEWWDAALLPSKTYDDLSRGLAALNIRSPGSPINLYVQHPIPIPGHMDKNKVALKPLMLTKKEQKKMRKQRRQADLQDKRDRIRMGLTPPDAPKVRLSNLMKVLTSDAVQDPTKVEARVRREVAMRKHQHDKMNAERKLTDEQRKEKIETKKVEEERKGLVGAAFKIKTLSDPSHRFKVRKNAEQMNLTGLCLFNPAFSLIYVEGAPKFLKQYKRLLLHRMQWTEAARPRGATDVPDVDEEDEEGLAASAGALGKGKGKEVVTDEGVVSLEDNRCDLVWEGQIADRAFRNFKPKSCPTDSSAKEALGMKLSSHWDTAKNWKPQEEELF
ncbi:pre-mRNA processing factor 3-domain-containing protein [Gautieria morchelliformis]|nr:pre-mRNA processing factor 3-domain-containing protein [Gautieria morchelliformis]